MESIEEIVHGDILEIKKLLGNSESIVADNLVREILRHIGEGVALKLIKDGKIVGVWCSLEFEEYTSLSYFYVDESIRRTMAVLEFFMTAGKLVNRSKPVMIATKDTAGFDRYVEKVGENLYRFKGLR